MHPLLVLIIMIQHGMAEVIYGGILKSLVGIVLKRRGTAIYLPGRRLSAIIPVSINLALQFIVKVRRWTCEFVIVAIACIVRRCLPKDLSARSNVRTDMEANVIAESQFGYYSDVYL